MMAHTIYYKLVRYFIGLMVLTCLMTSLLFFATAGRSLLKNVHQLLRARVTYITGEAQILLQNESSGMENLQQFMARTARTYGMGLVLYDNTGKRRTGSLASAGLPDLLDTAWVEAVSAEGIYIRPGHFSGTTIYLLPVQTVNQETYYLCFKMISRVQSSFGWLLAGICLMIVFLVLAIYPLARSFTRPIEQLSEGLLRMAQGDLDLTEAAIPNPENRNGDELARLTTIFKEMNQSVNEMMTAKKRFLADISHELRSPLGRMEVSLELLREGGDEKQTQRYISAMESEIQFMTEMIRSLSSYAKINLTDFKLNRVQVMPAQMLHKTADRYADMVDRQGLTLLVHMDEAMPDILADDALIIRVMNNLMDNAISYCHPGGTIGLEVRQEGQEVCFIVWDTGPGIPESEVSQIFDPLFRVDPSRSRNTGGLGLGLAICKKIVDHHHGRIEYVRENDTTSFRFYLPSID